MSDWYGRRLEEHLEEVSRQMRRRVQAEMGEMAEEILADAKRRAPRDTGELRDSGYIERRPSGDHLIGFRAEHAAAQHEILEYEHPNGGGPKYLEQALDAAARTAQKRLADAAGEVIR